jgi:hypothetical protein
LHGCIVHFCTLILTTGHGDFFYIAARQAVVRAAVYLARGMLRAATPAREPAWILRRFSTEVQFGVFQMTLEIWLPAMFALGIVLMGLCLLFLKACDFI